MVLVSGEVETEWSASAPFLLLPFRMVLLSGEVETALVRLAPLRLVRSGWFCYPGKLKPSVYCVAYGDQQVTGFRMVLLSGEVETLGKC